MGALVAVALQRSWQASHPTALELSDTDFEAVTPLLYDSGASSLGWWRIRDTPLAQTTSGELLHQAFRLLTLQAAIHQTRIQKVFGAFRSAGIDPILIKGWAVARRYPQPGLRPYGDIDLLVHPQDMAGARKVVASDGLRGCRVDLHTRPFELSDRSLDDLYSRSRLLQCADEPVRVLSNEDHLALISIHLLKHAAWRPLWLCDVALLLETADSEFDWQVCLGPDESRANWILSAIGLARELLHATVPDQVSSRAIAPQWLIESVLRNWAEPFVASHEPHNHRAAIKTYLTRPRGLLGDLRRRWPDPILATIAVHGRFGSRPRLSYQLHNCIGRAVRLVKPVAEPSS